MGANKVASLEATLVQKYDRPSEWLNSLYCRLGATSIAKNWLLHQFVQSSILGLVANIERSVHTKVKISISRKCILLK